MKQTSKRVPRHITGKRFSGRVHSLFVMLFLMAFMVSGVAESYAAEKPAIFWGMSMSPYGVPGDTPSTIHIEAYHYGRPIESIECRYEFYVVDYDTKQAVETFEGYNKKTITLPSNGGRLNADFEVNLPTGHYLLYYIYLDQFSGEGPFLFSDFWVGERPPTPQTATISELTLKESWQSKVGASEWYYSSEYGKIDKEAGTVAVTMEHWHKNLGEGRATVKLDSEGANFTVDDVTYRSGEEFTADLTQPVTIKVTSEDKSVTKDYTVIVTNGTDGSGAELGNYISFSYYSKTGGYKWAGAEYDEVSGEYIMRLEDKLWNIDNSGFEGEIKPSFGSSVKLNGEEIGLVCWYSSGQGTYRGSFNYLEPAKIYTFTVISADETVTNEYTVRVIEKETPPVWNDDRYCIGFRYREDTPDNITEAIPIEWLERVSIHLNESFFEENPVTDGHIMLRPAGVNDNFEISRYPHNIPDIPQYEAWFPMMMHDIVSGEYEVVLYSYPDEYILGSITLVDEIPAVYSISVATFANGKVSSHKDECTEGTEVTLWCWNITEGYEMASIEVYKTGEENTKLPLTGSGNGNYATRTFIMPAYDVTVTASFQKKQSTLDAEAVQAAKTAIEAATYTFSQADANTEADVKKALVSQINDLIPSGTSITITADNVSVNDFTPASNGDNGSFTFTVSLVKGSANDSAGKNGVISAISVYTVTIGTFTGGSVSANSIVANEGEDILLTISLETGYELNTIFAHKTGDNMIPVVLTGTGHRRTFKMPAYSVTVTAEFQIIQAQADREAVEDAAANIEEGTFNIAQAVGNTEAAIKSWLINTLKAMFGDRLNIVLRSDEPSLVGDVEVSNVTPPIAGTKANPKGVDGSFTFTVSLTRGKTLLMTETVSGVIKATPYKDTPPATVTYTLTATASEGGSISPSGSMNVDKGSDRKFTFTPDTDYEITEVLVDEKSVPEAVTTGSYTFENITGDHTIEVRFTLKTITGITGLQPGVLIAYVQNGILHISGLTPGQSWSVYSLTGRLIRQGTATGNEEKVSLPAQGAYIVKSGIGVVKVLY